MLLGLVNQIVKAKEALGLMAARQARASISDFFALETAEDATTLVGKDGSLVTVIEIFGARDLKAATEVKAAVDALSLDWAPFFSRPGHALQSLFIMNPDRAVDELRMAIRPARQTAKNLDLDLDDLFEEQLGSLPKWLGSERQFLALWTRPSLLSQAEMKIELETRAKKYEKAPKLHSRSQDPMRAYDAIRPRHSAYVQGILSSMRGLGFRCESLEVHVALNAIYGTLDIERAQSRTRFYLPGDAVPVRAREDLEVDTTAIQWPRLEDQMLKRHADVLSFERLQIGATEFAMADMSMAPERAEHFSRLITAMNSDPELALPWRMSVLLEPGGLSGIKVKRQIAAVLHWAHDHNKKIKTAIDALQAAALDDNAVDVRLRVSFATWGPVGSTIVQSRAAALAQAVESWGNAQVDQKVGDPLAAFMSSTLATSTMSTAPSAAASLADSMYFLPLNRVASPWDHGSVMLRTPDGKLMPYEPKSSKTTSFVEIIFAGSGKGKSVFLNNLNKGICLGSTAGVRHPKLPLLKVIDIGPSSAGLVNLLKDALPPDRVHEAGAFKLENRAAAAINIFDTQLGCRRPIEIERAFLSEILTLIGTPIGQDRPPRLMSELISEVIDALYEYRSDDVQPRSYNPGIYLDVDEALSDTKLEIDELTSWFEVEDALFAKGRVKLAALAHRQAMPLLEDIPTITSSGRVQAKYAAALDETGNSLIDVLNKLVAAAIRSYPILSAATVFDVSAARVCALDLKNVAPKGGDANLRQTTIMYLVAWNALVRDLFLEESALASIHPDYRTFHKARIRELEEVPKRVCLDELHRNQGSPPILNLLDTAAREARKAGVQLCVASQRYQDFSEALIAQASAVFILGAETDDEVDDVAQKFGLNPTFRGILGGRLNGPGRGGAPLIARFSTKEGKFTQFLYLTLGPLELWAFSTTAEDMALRGRLGAKLGSKRARQILASRFPGGSAVPEIEARKQALSLTDDSPADEQADGIIDQLVHELLQMPAGRTREAAE